MFEKIFEKNKNRLATADLKELSRKFRDIFAQLMARADNEFIHWAIFLAPVKLVPADSSVTTMAAANDGNIYINPAFYATIVEMSQQGGNPEEEVMYGILHEVLHHMFGHTQQELKSLHYQNNIPYKKALAGQYHAIANACMDLVINIYLNEMLPGAKVMQKIGITSKQKFLSMFRLQSLETLEKETFPWFDLYVEVIEKLLQQEQENDKGQGENSPEKGDEKNSPVSSSVKGVHGEEINPTDAVSVREEVQGEKTNWEEKREEIISRLKNSGNSAGGLLRALEGLLDPKIPWRRLIHNTVIKEIGLMNAISTYTKTNRRVQNLPGTIMEDMGTLWMLGDTSGSMSHEDLKTMLGTALSYLKNNGKVVLIPWDTKVYKPILFKSSKDLNKIKEIQGGGGTLLLPALEYVTKKIEAGDIIFIHTDSYIGDMEKVNSSNLFRKIKNKTGNPVVWFNTDRNNKVKISGVRIINKY